MEQTHVDAIRLALKNNFGDIAFADGHTIYCPEMYIRAGVPKEVVMKLDRSFAPDGSAKGIQEECRGVYHLSFLELVADVVGADTSIANTKFGRGSQAEALSEAIKAVM